MASTAPREVLLVEECDDLREVLCEVLGARGYHVLPFATLDEALRLPSRALHAILVAVNGYVQEPGEALEAVLQQPRDARAPIVALVSGAAQVQLQGVELALRKPVDEEQLCRALETCTHGSL